jgi:hypothetical protein
MKKLILVLAIVLATFTSCTQKAGQDAVGKSDSTTTKVDSVTVDSTAVKVDSVATK